MSSRIFVINKWNERERFFNIFFDSAVVGIVCIETYVADSWSGIAEDDNGRAVVVVNQRPYVWTSCRQGPLRNDIFAGMSVALEVK